jgi:hypothetical protein
MFRDLVRFKNSGNLVTLLQGLVVADALACEIDETFPYFARQFQEDIGRWSSMLNGLQHEIFEDIVQVVWRRSYDLAAHQTHDSVSDMQRFRDIITRFTIFSENLRPQRRHDGPRGTSLRHLREKFPRQSAKPDVLIQEDQSFDGNGPETIAGVLAQLTRDTDSSDSDEEFDLGDFIHLDALAEEPSVEKKKAVSRLASRNPDSGVDDDPTVVSLLSSVAFSTILIWISKTSYGSYDSVSMALDSFKPGYSRSCALVEQALGFAANADEDQAVTQKTGGIDLHVSRMKSYIRQKNSAPTFVSTPSTTSTTSIRSTARTSVSSPSASSFVSTDYTTDADSTAATGSARRLRCLSIQCPKTFSSVSNRNKHVREGCGFRDKKGYQCRNNGCKKVLTTKWYRNTHEEERCRFR